MKKNLILLSLSLAFLIGCSKDDSSAAGPDEALHMPTNLKAERVALKAVRLTWEDDTQLEEGYAIERRAGTGSFAQLLFTAKDVTTAIDSVGLTTGTTYSYRVRVVRYSERGEYSSLATITLSVPYP